VLESYTAIVVSSEFSGENFLEIYYNLSGNLSITYVDQLFPSPTLQIDTVKQTCS